MLYPRHISKSFCDRHSLFYGYFSYKYFQKSREGNDTANKEGKKVVYHRYLWEEFKSYIYDTPC